MLTSVDTNRQTYRDGWQTTAPTTGLRRVSRVHRNYRNCGTSCLLLQYIQELRPTRVMCRFGKIQGANHPANIQILVSDSPIATNQRLSRFVVKVLALVRNVSMNICKHYDRFATVCATALFSCYRSLGAATFDLCLAIQFGSVNLFAFTGNKKGFQAEVYSDSGIRGRFVNFLFYITNKHNVPMSRMTLERCGFYGSFNGAVQFQFDFTNVLKYAFPSFVSFAPSPIVKSMLSKRPNPRKRG